MTSRVEIDQAWTVAIETCAHAYHAEVEQLAAPSRGRGPRPPCSVWEAKKMAVHLAIVLADCTYAELGRHIGLHRDTVASHCAAVRASIETEEDEVSAHSLEAIARGRLVQRKRGRIDAMRAALAVLEETSGDLTRFLRSDASSDDRPTTHPTEIVDHGNVIVLAKAGAKR